MSQEDISHISVSLARIEEQVKHGITKTDKIEKILSGNGNPDTGLQSRMVRVESKMKILLWIVGTVATATLGYIVTAILLLL